MIRTISQENAAKSAASAAITPLSTPSAAAQAITPLTAPAGSSTGLDVTSASGVISTLLTEGEITPGSVWPLSGIDTFTEFTNDTGSVAQREDFNALVSAVRAIEAYTLRVARAAPGDLAERINTAGSRTL